MLKRHDFDTEGAIILFPKNDDVKKLNEIKIAALPPTADAYTYICVDHLELHREHRDDEVIKEMCDKWQNGESTELVRASPRCSTNADW
jgi:hypothetical protein